MTKRKGKGTCPKCGYCPFEPYAYSRKKEKATNFKDAYLRRCNNCGYEETD